MSSLRMVVVSSPTFKDGEPKTVCKLLENGLQGFHLRKPDHSTKQIAKFLDKIPNELMKRIIIHRKPELLKDYNVGGYHHTSKELLQKTSGIRSRSLHKLSELDQCERELDYVFFGPIFESISKVGHKPKTRLPEVRKRLEKYKTVSQRPLVYALGGIRKSKISYLWDSGFDGVALLGAVWGKPDPLSACKEFSKAMEIQSLILKNRNNF